MRFFKWFLIALLLGAVVIYLMLPAVIKSQANKRLATLPDYKGHVEQVTLSPLRGAFQLGDLRLIHKDGDLIVTIAKVRFSFHWLPLLRKQVIASLLIDQPIASLSVKTPMKAPPVIKEKTAESKAAIKAMTGKDLPDLLASLIPFRIDSFVLKDGICKLEERKSADAEQVFHEAKITDLYIKVTNLTNSPRVSETLTADGTLRAKLMGNSDVKADFKLNPLAKTPAFNLRLDIQKFNLTDLNPLLRWQWDLDVDSGTFALFVEASAAEGNFTGYVKPFVNDLEMHHSKKDPALKTIKKAVVGAVAAVLENRKKNQLAARVPFSGSFDNPRIGIWSAVVTVFENAFIEALKPTFDKSR